MALGQVFDTPHRSPERLAALAALDTTDLVLAVMVLVEEHRLKHGFIRRDDIAIELAEVVIAANQASVTHHVASVALLQDALGHLAVQYGKLTLGPDSSFDDALANPDEHQRIIAGHYALWMANTPEKWNGGNAWSADSMIKLLPFLEDETALFKLATQVRINLASAALKRYAEVVDIETLEYALTHVPFMVRDAEWIAAASLMGENARAELAFRSNFSFVRREAMQATLPTKMLLAHLEQAPENVKEGIEKVLNSRK